MTALFMAFRFTANRLLTVPSSETVGCNCGQVARTWRGCSILDDLKLLDANGGG